MMLQCQSDICRAIVLVRLAWFALGVLPGVAAPLFGQVRSSEQRPPAAVELRRDTATLSG